jgi:uncharacterized repeat protein (TIGR03803 family)
MTPSPFRRSALALSAAALLGGCGGSQPPIGAPGAMPQTWTVTTRAERSKSWMLPEAKMDYRVLYSFTGNPDGAGPGAGLLAFNGKLYGTTWSGGANNDGTIFAVTRQGAETVLYSFTGGTDGSNPGAPLVNVKGTLYGTTRNGGAKCSSSDCGTVFKITKSGKETVLHSFGGSGDGATPVAALINVKGTLYGTTLKGGVTSSHSCTYTRFDSSCGTVFSITTSGVENVLYRFAGIPNAQNPAAALTNVNGKLYGTTEFGGTSGRFQLV